MGVISYILGLVVITILSFLSLIFFLLNTDPASVKASELIIFYSSFCLGLSGLLALLETLLRKRLSSFRLNWRMINLALRDALWISFVITVLLFIQAKRALNLTGLGIILSIGLIVLAYFNLKNRRHEKRIGKN